jgi:hypothetical protein
MGVRDAGVVTEQSLSLGLEALAVGEMPANSRTLVFRKRGWPLDVPNQKRTMTMEK